MTRTPLALVALTGCATLFNEPARIPVATNPPGAAVYVNGQIVGQTPTMVQLDPERPANIQIYMPGFQPVQMWRHRGISGWFWVNILFWPGFIVDLATGKYQRYDNSGIAIGLVPEAGPPPDWYQPQPSPYPQPPGPAPVQPGMQ
jgi:hypothetical protein